MPTCSCGPRSNSSMNGSPAICSANRVHRAHWTQRSRSSSTWVEIAIGLGKVRLTSVNRVSPCPLDIAWFCSGHSPPLSHIGQSSGWLTSSISMTPRCAFSATGEVSWVCTTMPSVQAVVQEASGFGWPSTSTRHCRQAPTGSSSGWSQNRGIWMPSSSAARMISVPLGTRDLEAVDGDVDRRRHRRRLVAGLGGGPSSRHSRVANSGRGGRVERAAAALLVLDVLVPEVLDRRGDRADRAVAERRRTRGRGCCRRCRAACPGPPRCPGRAPAARGPGRSRRCPRGTGVHLPQDSCS